MPTLREPFTNVQKKDIKNKNGDVVARVDYIEWADAADRLDDAEPGWSFAIIALGADWCHGRLTFADGRFFENIGYAENAEMAWKKEPLKDAVSDSLKRCAALAGVARYLYNGSGPATVQNGHSAPVQRPAPQRAAPRASSSTVPPEPDWMTEASPVEVLRTRDYVADDYGTCPDHNIAWKLVPAGISKKTGKEYAAFYACPEMGCKEKPAQPWLEAMKAAR